MVRLDLSCLRIDRKKYGGLESVVSGEDFRQHWKRFFRTVFIITTDQNDVTAIGELPLRFKRDPLLFALPEYALNRLLRSFAVSSPAQGSFGRWCRVCFRRRDA